MIRKIIKAIKMVSTDQEQFLLTLLAKLRLRKVSKIYKNRELFHSYKGELFPDYLNHVMLLNLFLRKLRFTVRVMVSM